jgi:CRISPR-associated protein Cas2
MPVSRHSCEDPFLCITDKQFGNIELFYGTKPQMPNAPGQQLELF